jgi:hypothetical protein
MKRLLASLGFLILATGCDSFTPPVVPTPPQGDPAPTVETAFISGVVSLMTADGAVPVEGAIVELLANTDPALMRTNPAKGRTAGRKAEFQVVVSTVTDADGWYSFSGIGYGTYALRISKDGATLFSSEEFQVSGDTQMDAELHLEDNGAPSRLRRVRR